MYVWHRCPEVYADSQQLSLEVGGVGLGLPLLFGRQLVPFHMRFAEFVAIAPAQLRASQIKAICGSCAGCARTVSCSAR